MLNEADKCTRYIVHKLREAGWDADPHSFNEQHHRAAHAARRSR